jgi:hypothetical protein
MKTSRKGIWLYDRNGTTWLADDVNGNQGPDGKSGQIVFTFPISGTYYLKVDDTTYAFDTGLGAYSLRICEDICSVKVFLPLILR